MISNKFTPNAALKLLTNYSFDSQASLTDGIIEESYNSPEKLQAIVIDFAASNASLGKKRAAIKMNKRFLYGDTIDLAYSFRYT